MNNPTDDYIQVNVSLASPMAARRASDPARQRADEGILRAHWQYEARAGFPVLDSVKATQRQLMALSGVVSTEGHVLTKAARERIESEKQVTTTKPAPTSNRK
jgi:hypothetical protein